MSYVVVREYSGHTAKKTLWKVLSRPIRDKRIAEDWMRFMKKEEKTKGKDFFIVEVDF